MDNKLSPKGLWLHYVTRFKFLGRICEAASRGQSSIADILWT